MPADVAALATAMQTQAVLPSATQAQPAVKPATQMPTVQAQSSVQVEVIMPTATVAGDPASHSWAAPPPTKRSPDAGLTAQLWPETFLAGHLSDRTQALNSFLTMINESLLPADRAWPPFGSLCIGFDVVYWFTQERSNWVFNIYLISANAIRAVL